MKLKLRALVIGAAIVLFALPSTATADQRPVQVLIGAVFAHMRFDANANLGVSWRGNAMLGVDFGVPLFPESSKVQLRGEALLVPRGGNVDNGLFIEKIKFLYVDLAGLIDVQVKPSFHLLAGPVLSTRFTGVASINGSPVDITGVFRRVDAGVAVGADVTLVPKRLEMQVLYIQGLLNILANSTSQAKNQTLLVMFSPSAWR